MSFPLDLKNNNHFSSLKTIVFKLLFEMSLSTSTKFYNTLLILCKYKCIYFKIHLQWNTYSSPFFIEENVSITKIWLDKQYFFQKMPLITWKYNSNDEDYTSMFSIMYSKPNATFKMGGPAEVTVSFSVTSTQRGDILISLHRTRWHESC